MRVKLHIATADDIADLVALRIAVNQHLTAQYGKGYWSGGVTEKGVLSAMRNSAVYVARYRNRLIATLTLCTKKPWAIDIAYFTPATKPLYLTGMAVHPDFQRQGIGRLVLKEAEAAARAWPADAIRLDAFNAEAGAGGFYAKCGFREVARVTYKRDPLIYFEMLLPPTVANL